MIHLTYLKLVYSGKSSELKSGGKNPVEKTEVSLIVSENYDS